MDQDKRKCKCQDCGRDFYYGQEGDNEKFCLKCERLSLTRDLDQLDYEDFDRLESERD